MRPIGTTIIGLLFSIPILAQTVKAKGKIGNVKEEAVTSATIYIEGSIDGGSSEEDGTFSFETSATGIVKLVVTAIGYKKLVVEKPVKELHDLTLTMAVDLNTLKEVEITAGSFQVKGSSNIESKQP